MKLTEIDMLSAARGWALTAQGLVLRTTDGGKLWLDVSPSVGQVSSSNVTVRAVFVDATHAFVAVGRSRKYALSSVTLYVTADGGLRWRKEVVPMPDWMAVQGFHMRFLGDRLGYVLLYAGVDAFSEPAELLRTRDGGLHFTVAAAGEPLSSRIALLSGDKTGFGFADAKHGVVTGGSAASTIFLDVTSDGGASWIQPILTVPKGLSAFGGGAESYPPTFFSSLVGVMPVAFYGHIVFYRTADGGLDWLPTAPIKTDSFALGPWSIDGPSYALGPWSFAGPLDGFVTVGAELYHTDDGGEQWTRVPGRSLSLVTQLDFIDASRGWAISDGNLFQTRVGGTKWQRVPLRISDIDGS